MRLMMEQGSAWRLVTIEPDGTGAGVVRESSPLEGVTSVSALLATLRAAPAPRCTHLLQDPSPAPSGPERLAALAREAARAPDAVILGGAEAGARWPRAWRRLAFRLATGFHLRDPEAPLRLYPLDPLRRLAERRLGRGWQALELLAHLAWGGVSLREVSTVSPLAKQDHPGRAATASPEPVEGPLATAALDGASALPACVRTGALRYAALLIRRLIPWPHPALCAHPAARLRDLLHPRAFFGTLLKEHATPYDLALASFVGVFMGALPLLACHTVAILYVTTRFRLNRAMAVVMQNLCAPPLVPFLCVEVGYVLRKGTWLTELNRQTLLLELHQRLLDWFLGSLLVGPALGLLVAGTVFAVSTRAGGWLRRRGAGTRIGDRRRGNRAGYASFVVMLRLFGRRGAYTLLAFVAGYYLVFDALARRLARPYLGRRFPDHGRWRRMGDIYRLFYNQGVTLIDRFRILMAPQAFRQEVAHYERVEPLVRNPRGFILLVSHVGNWQALMLALSRMERNVTLLMRPEENPVNRDYLRFGDFGQRFRMVSPDADFGGVVELTRRFNEGDVIAIMGDRAYGAATLPVDFLGAPAQFPRGPFQLAAAWECPVVVMFAAKTGTDAYTVDMADVIEVERGGNRQENLRRAMQRYAHRLEEFAQRHPYQVHLFEDVWAV